MCVFTLNLTSCNIGSVAKGNEAPHWKALIFDYQKGWLFKCMATSLCQNSDTITLSMQKEKKHKIQALANRTKIGN